MQSLDLMPLMAQKIKVGIHIYDAFNTALDAAADSFEGATGLKSTCVEAALLCFFRLGKQQKVELIKEVKEAEMMGQVDDVVQRATAPPLQLKTAAKVAKPGKSKGKKPPPGQT